MALQFLVGSIVTAVTIMIHALVTVGAIRIARQAGLKNTTRPQLHLMTVMVEVAAVLVVAHTIEVVAWALTYAVVGAAPEESGFL
jgi:chromate transport protein ChrA